MTILNYLSSDFVLKKARKLAAEAHLADGEKADQLFQEAYKNFASYSTYRALYPDCLHSWGLALVNQAGKKTGDNALKILDEAIVKFNLCDAVKPDHLGAFLDGGVALMTVAKIKCLSADDEWYVKAKKSFVSAEEIQQGSASYNLACLYAMQSNTDACLDALEKARDCGIIPDEQDILTDTDLDNVKQLSWFDEFISSLSLPALPEEMYKDPYK